MTGPRFVTAARVLPVPGSAPIVDGCVEIAGGRVVALGRRVDFGTRLESAAVLDVPDGTVLPGLVDSHCHLTFPADGRSLGEMAADPPTRAPAVVAGNLARHLAAGVTTVRDLGCREGALREVRVPGPGRPRVLTAGSPITRRRGHTWWLGGEVHGLGQIRALTDRLVAAGVDTIKVMASGGATEGTNPGEADFTARELTEIVRRAHAAGVPVAAHCHATESMRRAVRAGVDSLEHASFLAAPRSAGEGRQTARTARFTVGAFDVPDDLLAEIRAAGTTLSLTLLGVRTDSVGAVRAAEAAGRPCPPELVADARKVALLDLMRRQDLLDQLVISTDAGPVDKGFGDLAEPLGFAVAAGLPAPVALRAVTVNAARSCGLGSRAGTVAVGEPADLLAVRGDPSTDILTLRQVSRVLVGGCG